MKMTTYLDNNADDDHNDDHNDDDHNDGDHNDDDHNDDDHNDDDHNIGGWWPWWVMEAAAALVSPSAPASQPKKVHTCRVCLISRDFASFFPR